MADDFVWVMIAEPIQGTDAASGSRDGGASSNPFDDPSRSESLDGVFLKRVKVRAEKLEQGVNDFLQVMGRVLNHAQKSAGELAGMELDEIELSVEVSGEGQLSLLGSGGKVGSKGAMTLKFKKATASPPETASTN